MRAVLLLLALAAASEALRSSHPKLPLNLRGKDFAPQHSFVPPLLTEAWAAGVPHWDFGLSAVVARSYVRLTPDAQSREGWMWNTDPLMLHSWTVHAGIHVSNNGALGGDGLGFWLAERPRFHGGPLMGIHDRNFQGLGIVFDSYDNDGRRDNPAVYLLASSDGHTDFLPGNDFSETRSAACVFDYRNTAPDDLVHVTVDYDGDSGSLEVRLHRTGHPDTMCFRHTVRVPLGYYFGMSAHTGGATDAHDVHYFAVSGSELPPEPEHVYNRAQAAQEQHYFAAEGQ